MKGNPGPGSYETRRPTMYTPIGTDQACEEAVIAAKPGEVKPIHTFSPGRRGIDEDTVADLVSALRRDGRFLHPILVRAEGASQYRLIAGGHRLEAWKRCFGERQPIPAVIYPPGTPDAQMTILEIEENLVRKELSAAEREAQMLRLAAALKKLNDGKASGESAETGNSVPSLAPASGGRGNKGVAQKVAGKADITRRAVNKRLKAASAAIGERIDLDLDTPEELERKADKRQQAQPKPKVERRKRTKPAPCAAIEDPTQPAEPPAAEIDRRVGALREAFAAVGRKHQLRFIHDACLRLGLDPLMMAPPAAFGLAEEDPELAVDLPAEVPPATEDAPVAAQAEQRDDVADIGTEDLQDAGDEVAEAADQENPGAGKLQDDDHDVSEAAHQVPGEATKCALCHDIFLLGDPAEMFNGRFYHRIFCLKDVKATAITADLRR